MKAAGLRDSFFFLSYDIFVSSFYHLFTSFYFFSSVIILRVLVPFFIVFGTASTFLFFFSYLCRFRVRSIDGVISWDSFTALTIQ